MTRLQLALLVLLPLASLTACAGLASSATERAPESPASHARPDTDPELLETPRGATALVPVEQVSVRVRRVADGRLSIVEFLSPQLPEADQVKLRLAYEAGELRLAGQGAPGDESWITTLLRTR
jgi:hypothetical protein